MSQPVFQIAGYLRPGTYVGRSSGAFAPISIPMPTLVTPTQNSTTNFPSTPSVPVSAGFGLEDFGFSDFGA